MRKIVSRIRHKELREDIKKAKKAGKSLKQFKIEKKLKKDK
jgi:hypothetical protein